MTVDAPGSLVLEQIASFLLFPADISSATALFSVNKHFHERFANMHAFWRAKCAEFGFSFERTKTEGLTWFQLFRYCWTHNINVHVLMRDGQCSSTKKRPERFCFFGLFLRRPLLGEWAAGDVSASIAEETSFYLCPRQVVRIYLSHESRRGLSPQVCGAWSAFDCMSLMDFTPTSDTASECPRYRSSCTRILEEWRVAAQGRLVQHASLIDAASGGDLSFEDAVAMLETMPDSFCKRFLQNWASVALFRQPKAIECLRCGGQMLVFQFRVGIGTSPVDDHSVTSQCQRCALWLMEDNGYVGARISHDDPRRM